MSNPNPPTARSGIKSSLSAEAARVEASEPKREITAGDLSQKELATSPKANATGSEMLNPKASRGESEVDETLPSWKSFEGDEEAWAALDAERIAFTREALAGYRNMLVGIRAKLRADIATGIPGSLNPEGALASTKESLRQVRTGIAKANVLLEELGDAQPMPEA